MAPPAHMAKVETMPAPQALGEAALAPSIPDFLHESNHRTWRIPLVSSILVSSDGLPVADALPLRPATMKDMSDKLTIAGREFTSRLIVGTGKYRTFQEMQRCHEASGADMVTVAVRRVNLTDRSKESLLDYIDRTQDSSFCPIRRVATPPMTPSARPCWVAKWGSPIG